MNPIRVLAWDEAPPHAPKSVYPKSINGAIADYLNSVAPSVPNNGGTESIKIVATAVNLDDPSQGITEDALANADVLIWWGHARHGEVTDETAEMIKKAVHKGLGFIALHSAHYAKPFKAILNCSGDLKGGWREMNPPETEEITVCAPKHPIAEGIDDFVLDREEMYGSPFAVPPFETMIFQSYFPHGGEYFPNFATTVGEGIDPTFTSGPGGGKGQGKGVGRVFYFRPGHETFPTYFHPTVQKILYNAVKWCAKRI